MLPTKTAEQIDRIIDELDTVTLLSAAWDCMPETGKAKFKHRLAKILLPEQPRADSSA